MTRRPIVMTVDAKQAQPLFLQIARGIRERILAGQLRPGDQLPGSRSLADSLKVHRNTVLAAFDELMAEGWLVAKQGGGTFISEDLPPVISPPAEGPPIESAGFAMPQVLGWDRPDLKQEGLLDLSKGIPDTRLLPTAQVAAAFRRVFQNNGPEVLAYGDPQGQRPLREALSRHLSDTRGLAVGPENLLITRGSQQALDLVFRLLLKAGDRVAVEELGYPRVHAALRHAGIVLSPMALDDRGLQIDHLEARLQRETIKAIYVTPHHQYPTMATLTADRRLRLIELAHRYRIPVIEDDYDHEFHYDGPPVLPMASLRHEGAVIYLGTLSKILAPGLRIGYIAAPVQLIDKLVSLRKHLDISGEPVVQLAAAELLTRGEAQRHANKVRRIYQARRNGLAHALQRELGSRVTFRLPTGGLGLWLQADPRIDVDRWETRAREHGVAFLAGRRLAIDERYRPALRLVYAAHDEAELGEAVRRLVQALPS